MRRSRIFNPEPRKNLGSGSGFLISLLGGFRLKTSFFSESLILVQKGKKHSMGLCLTIFQSLLGAKKNLMPECADQKSQDHKKEKTKPKADEFCLDSCNEGIKKPKAWFSKLGDGVSQLQNIWRSISKIPSNTALRGPKDKATVDSIMAELAKVNNYTELILEQRAKLEQEKIKEEKLADRRKKNKPKHEKKPDISHKLGQKSTLLRFLLNNFSHSLGLFKFSENSSETEVLNSVLKTNLICQTFKKEIINQIANKSNNLSILLSKSLSKPRQQTALNLSYSA
jgi:hypothetical protein